MSTVHAGLVPASFGSISAGRTARSRLQEPAPAGPPSAEPPFQDHEPLTWLPPDRSLVGVPHAGTPLARSDWKPVCFPYGASHPQWIRPLFPQVAIALLTP